MYEDDDKKDEHVGEEALNAFEAEDDGMYEDEDLEDAAMDAADEEDGY